MKIRAGDIVTVRILVTEVADYASKEDPNGQQVMGRMLPRGGQLGWLVPQESKVTIDELQFRVGDSVELGQGQAVVLAIFRRNDGRQDLWVKPDGSDIPQTIALTKEIRRI